MGTTPSTLRFDFRAGLYVVTLPVTTQVSVAGGREIWGFPKYMAEMQSDFSDPKKASFVLGDEFSATLEQGFTIPTPGLPFLTYAEQPGSDITRTKIRVGHSFRCARPASDHLTRLDQRAII